MKYTIKEREFKGLGYTFQKLYARDYKCYWKSFDGISIWCWVKGKEIQVSDWYEHTEMIINFLRETKGKEDSPYFKFLLNRDTKEVFSFWPMFKDVLGKFDNDPIKALDHLSDIYEVKHLHKSTIEDLLKEIEKISKI
jgi:hypothetical protein